MDFLRSLECYAGKQSGLPDLPPDVNWPVFRDCTSSYASVPGSDDWCGFVAQFNCADFAETLAGRLVPSTGLISVFLFMNRDTGDDRLRGLYSPDISALVRKEAPDGLAAATKIRKAEQLTYAEVLDIPDPEGPWEDELELNDQVRDDYGMFRPDSDMFGYFSPTTGEDKDTQPFLSIRPTEGCGIHIQLKRADLAVGDFDAAQLVWVDCG
jgi:hypothetical protein